MSEQAIREVMSMLMSSDVGLRVLSEQLDGSIAEVVEKSEGNVNHVFQVIGGNDEMICVKQSLDHLRIVPEMKLGKKRICFEYMTLCHYEQVMQGSVPKVLAFDEPNSFVVMEYLKEHEVLRKLLVDAERVKEIQGIAHHVSRIVARVAFATCDFGMGANEKRKLVAKYSDNWEMCDLTEHAVFTCVYAENPKFANRWTCPYLDSIAEKIRRDGQLKAQVLELKQTFTSNTQALIHGDLHTGSIMVKLKEKNEVEDLRVFDLEFAFMGPIGFDLGAIIANLLLAYCSNPREYLLQESARVLEVFIKEFSDLFQHNSKENSFKDDLLLSLSQEDRESILGSFLDKVVEDSIGFAGCEMIRRILGIAHVEDFESIADEKLRAERESRALEIGRRFVLNRATYAQRKLKDLHRIVDLKENTFTLVMVAKFPRAKRSKTRLAKSIGDDSALQFAQACIGDLIERFSSPRLEQELGSVRRVILFAPAEDEEPYRAWLRQECGVEVCSKWEFKVMQVQEAEHSRIGKLGFSLGNAYDTLDCPPIGFIGMDTPDLDLDEVIRGFKTASKERAAFISPASDGGYVLLNLPSGCPPYECFHNVHWSTALACATQMQAICNVGINVFIGNTYSDCDEYEDLVNLKRRSKDQSSSLRYVRFLNDLNLIQ